MDGSHLKVLYISRGYSTHDRRFLGSFVRSGWSPVHLPLLEERLDARPLPDGVRSVRWTASLREPGSAADWRERRARLVEIVARTRPAIVIAGPVQSAAFLAALARTKPLVAVSWGTDLLVDADATAFSRFVTRFTLDNADAMLGDCRAVREAVHRHSSISDDRIVTFPWGIDLDRFRPGGSSVAVRGQCGWSGNDSIFISTRSWEPVYAIDVLVRAFALVIRRMPDARLLLLGDGSREGEIRVLLNDLSLDRFVHAPGRVTHDRLPDYFRAADAYVSSALSDGTSVSLLEAMACGLPVVVADSHGNREWVREGMNGALARPGDAESLSKAMLRVLSNRDSATHMGAANVAAARSRANWDENFPKFVRLAESLASGISERRCIY